MQPLLSISCNFWTDRVDESGRCDRALLLFLLPSRDTISTLPALVEIDVGRPICACEVIFFSVYTISPWSHGCIRSMWLRAAFVSPAGHLVTHLLVALLISSRFHCREVRRDVSHALFVVNACLLSEARNDGQDAAVMGVVSSCVRRCPQTSSSIDPSSRGNALAV